jgi:Uncharacterized protein conserved in bacteria
MPSFDIVSEVDRQELDNALNQARKELATRFDFKGSTAAVDLEKDKIVLTAEDANRLHGLREIVITKLSKRGVDLRNIKQDEAAISSMGHARQELKIQQGLEGEKARRSSPGLKPPVSKPRTLCRTGRFALPAKRRTSFKPSSNSFAEKTSESQRTSKTFGIEFCQPPWTGGMMEISSPALRT